MSDFYTTGWSEVRSTWSDFNATGWVNNSGVTAGASSAASLASEQTVQEIATEALSAKRSTDNQRTDNDIPFHLSQISLRDVHCLLLAGQLCAVERRPISAHEVAAEIALDWRGFYVMSPSQ